MQGGLCGGSAAPIQYLSSAPSIRISITQGGTLIADIKNFPTMQIDPTTSLFVVPSTCGVTDLCGLSLSPQSVGCRTHFRNFGLFDYRILCIHIVCNNIVYSNLFCKNFVCNQSGTQVFLSCRTVMRVLSSSYASTQIEVTFCGYGRSFFCLIVVTNEMPSKSVYFFLRRNCFPVHKQVRSQHR